jgi:predicted RNase H-like HicB family nuclease|tara:strand:- start:919 stop:1167 length:249 start_codon:yes stop_codon:yes gene_type:complete
MCINISNIKFYKDWINKNIMENAQVSFPIVVMKEGSWFVASCPLLDIATQGKTEQEVKENMADLIDEYLEDNDVFKRRILLN